MVDHDLALEALSALCNTRVTSSQKHSGLLPNSVQLYSNKLIRQLLDGEASCPVAGRILHHIHTGGQARGPFPFDVDVNKITGKFHIINEHEFFDPKYHYDFTKVKDTQTYYRGGEKYERPCGWQRFAIKVLDKYGGNTWLGNTNRSTQSVSGEWPVSYHGTSLQGAEGIIERHYKPGPGEVYGRGIYSTPDLSEASVYAKSFTSKKTGKRYKVILQNRINPEYRVQCSRPKYWLVRVPKEVSSSVVEELVERAIRPYGLLLKEVRWGTGHKKNPKFNLFLP
ncbi:uncharacterized protein LOC113133585 [Mastacembelus armatus]|uniref:uncharacterized protein LOC113133585 n=1 Tax=Mastacembelus armatus TaxID=205130 RepID=UPI000E45914C|nr:uncharacterized protein LOC113133585 [Mastacembelus armatus]